MRTMLYGYILFLYSKNGLLIFLMKKVDRKDLIRMYYLDSGPVKKYGIMSDGQFARTKSK